MDPKEINETFKTFYSNVYTSEFHGDISGMSAFLNDLNIQTINPDHKERLEQPIELQEILKFY